MGREVLSAREPSTVGSLKGLSAGKERKSCTCVRTSQMLVTRSDSKLIFGCFSSGSH